MCPRPFDAPNLPSGLLVARGRKATIWGQFRTCVGQPMLKHRLWKLQIDNPE